MSLIPHRGSPWATGDRKAPEPMNITLHLGAHRTASTVFQTYLRENARALKALGIVVWEPSQTRGGLLRGIVPLAGTPENCDVQLIRARGRISEQLQRCADAAVKHVIVSDENMIGAPRRNLKDMCLYAGVGERLALFGEAFEHRINRVVLSIRAQDSYWSSVIAYAVGRGHAVPSKSVLQALTQRQRAWRDVIADVSAALPDTEIVVVPYETFGGFPERKLGLMTGLASLPMQYAREWMNRAPSLPQLRQILRDRGTDPACLPEGEGRWQPFDPIQVMTLRETYADDLFWLRAGAEGKAQFVEQTRPVKMGHTPHPAMTVRGQTDGIEERRMA